ncbi:MAG: hypothetical protein KIT84_44575 [Labilithrix sp.]|nr:hypothetical protein [Labilithrix sp.]MCW5818156.1 hypothetical protein [Labilithrix sp.]
MTIIVAVHGAEGIAVGSDQRRFEIDGSHRDDYPKAFRLTKDLLIAHAGLLEIGGVKLETLIRSAGPASTDANVQSAARLAADAIIERLRASDHQEAIEVLLIGRATSTARGLGELRAFRIERVLDRYEVQTPPGIESWTGPEMRALGDGPARAAVAKLAGTMNFKQMKQKDLNLRVSELIREGIRASGPHQHFPHEKTCGGAPHVFQRKLT